MESDVDDRSDASTEDNEWNTTEESEYDIHYDNDYGSDHDYGVPYISNHDYEGYYAHSSDGESSGSDDERLFDVIYADLRNKDWTSVDSRFPELGARRRVFIEEIEAEAREQPLPAEPMPMSQPSCAPRPAPTPELPADALAAILGFASMCSLNAAVLVCKDWKMATTIMPPPKESHQILEIDDTTGMHVTCLAATPLRCSAWRVRDDPKIIPSPTHNLQAGVNENMKRAMCRPPMPIRTAPHTSYSKGQRRRDQQQRHDDGGASTTT